MYNLINTHCHLDFFDNLEEILDNAVKKHVTRFIAPAVDLASSKKLYELSSRFPQIKIAVGLHPVEIIEKNLTPEAIQQEMQALAEMLETKPKTVVALGECGLDFKYAITYEQQQLQIEAFKLHLELATAYQLPLIIHNRKANDQLLDLLTHHSAIQAVFHCFANSKHFAKQLLAKGYFLGIGGLMTVDQGLAEVVKTLPLTSILLETDAPYITPSPVKQERPWPNEPANVFYVAQKMAEVKHTTIIEVARQTTLNAQKLFRLQ